MLLLSYNLRFDALPDDITVKQSLDSQEDPLILPNFLHSSGEKPWSLRRMRIAEQILGESPLIAGFQEALIRQIEDLQELLGDQWSWTGVGRDDGQKSGEFCPVFYRSDKLNLVSSDSFWLSETPFQPSKYPDAGSFRICTVTRFTNFKNDTENKAESTMFTVLNTHLDNCSDAQRRLGASLLLARARFEAFTTCSPVFIMGDLNSPSEGPDSGAYDILTGVAHPMPIAKTFMERFKVAHHELPCFKMLDLRGKAPRLSVSANVATFTGFCAPDDTKEWTRIDFIFGGNNGGWTVHGYRVVTALSDDGVLASDHRPTFVDVSV